ncbi:type II and III secretion system protein [bacterium]|nr:MAG: type II and III secretion system protein [bacterium]
MDFLELPRGTDVTNPAGSAFEKAFSKAPGLGQFSRMPWNFRTILNAMVTKKEAKILARPTLQVIDNGQASFFVGDTIRARIVTGGALGAQNVDIREFPVGIILLVAPRVNADGNITLHVNPVVSTVNSVDANNIPQTSAREAETTAIVKSGETVVLGGLIRDEDTKIVEEVPFLSKLPLVGQLFRNRTRNHRRSDIIVSITPHLIDDENPNGGKP